MKQFIVQAAWDPEAAVWWGSSDELPLTTEADTFDGLVARVLEIAPQIIELNKHAKAGEQVEIHITADRVASVRVPAAA